MVPKKNETLICTKHVFGENPPNQKKKKKKKVRKKRKNPPCPFHPPKNNSLEGEKKRENSTLTFRNNQTSPLSHVNQKTTPR